ncbi:MAG: hypothetical protein NXH70_02275 [Hyphomonas sp.]|nr:hypothetical protein [Hyphomonas sp.]
MISLEPIYKLDSKGKLRTWQAQVEGSRWRTIAGLHDGSLVTSGWTDCVAKSQDSDEEQALFEAKAARDHKLAREYYDNIETAMSGVPAMFKPMLAKDFAKIKPEKLSFPCWMQPKLDGIRCIIKSDGAWTRQNKPILSIPHIVGQLAPFFEAFPDAVLDGELYNHELREDFQQITSIVRRDLSEGQNLTKKKEDERVANLEKAVELIQYHVYDATGSCEGESAPVRLEDFVYFHDMNDLDWDDGDICNGYLHLVRTEPVLKPETTDALHGQFTGQGYEGSMIRLDGPYENKRSGLLLKRKDFDTAEYTIERVEEGNGNWKGYAKRIVYRTAAGHEFGSGVRGTQAQMRDVLDNANDYVGSVATVRYFGLTDDGIPRFPVTIDFHGENRVD